MYTANTMASAIEALGMSLPGSSAQTAVGESKKKDCENAGKAVLNLLEKNIRPRDIMTKKAFENAITTCLALGDPPTSYFIYSPLPIQLMLN